MFKLNESIRSMVDHMYKKMIVSCESSEKLACYWKASSEKLACYWKADHWCSMTSFVRRLAISEHPDVKHALGRAPYDGSQLALSGKRRSPLPRT